MRMRKKKNGALRLNDCADLLITKREDIPCFPITVEIGCGKGKFILETAKRNPDTQYVAMEKIPDVAMLAAEKIRDEGITNVRFIVGDAMTLPELFGENEIERIYLNFSDPWPHNGHAKRRLTDRGFLELYKRLLIPTGEIVFKTDNRPLFDFSLEEFKYMGFELEDLTYDLHNSEYMADNIVTEYEANFSAKGFSINRVRAKMSRITNLEVRKADISELDRINEMFGEARAFMASQSIDQWQDGYPERALLEKDILEGNRYVVCEEGKILASVGFFKGDDPTYAEIDGKWINDSSYLSIHRICVDNSAKGTGLGGVMVRACEELCRQNKCRNIRCDTHADNKPMRRMLEKNGFVYCGIIHLENGDPRVAYQKKMR